MYIQLEEGSRNPRKAILLSKSCVPPSRVGYRAKIDDYENLKHTTATKDRVHYLFGARPGVQRL